MIYRDFKKTGKKISLLGLGCMRLPRVNADSTEIDVPAAAAMVERAFAAGINYFDTAHMYHGGTSQPVMGEILSRYPRESFHLATKMPPWPVESEEDVHRIFDEQLNMCRVDYFDFYLIHNINTETRKKAEKYRFYDILKEKQREGKIKRLGFSFHDRPKLLEEMVTRYDFDFVQMQLNYLDWELQDAKGQYEILADRGIPVVVMEPVRGGALAALPEPAGEILKSANPAASEASWAIRFAASLPGVLTVLSGMSNMEQLNDNISTVSDFKPLESAERGVLARALEAYRKTATVPCTACGYCMDCPFGVDIPKVFGIYNQYRRKGKNASIPLFLSEYSGILGEEKQAIHCTGCGRCLTFCPQGIKIPDELKKIADLVAQSKAQA
ncbi:MAG: aldo/keto reductase [Oscillospiraceae bacterium]|jgi:predicted aldo/keto reductase-like oxidoreductase|nr:aldo/keto reductase [Oscillospiraceae bacterium]